MNKRTSFSANAPDILKCLRQNAATGCRNGARWSGSPTSALGLGAFA
jgi:hypothetical protein